MKEQIKRLTKYLNHLTDRLSSPTPQKHLHRPESYKRFLLNEIAVVTAKMESIKLDQEKK